MAPTSTDERPTLSEADRAELSRYAQGAREARRLAKAATRKLDAGEYNEAFVALLEVLNKWADGGNGDLAIALIAQAACHARKLKAPRDIIEAAEDAERQLNEVRKELGVSPSNEEPDQE